MPLKILLGLLLACTTQGSFAGNYVIQIGDDAYEISLDEDVLIRIGGENFPVRLMQKEVLTYKTESFSFSYPRQYSPSKSDLGGGTFQTALMTPLGSLVMVQEYLNLNPSDLIDFMVNEVTKEEREYGYKVESANTSVTLSDGKVLNGKVITSKYKDSDIKRFVYTYGVKDSGLLILTQVDSEIEPDAEALIDDIINSLKVTLE